MALMDRMHFVIINKFIKKMAYLTITLKAPNGVTKIAGANPYAVKFAASPTITISSYMK